jgi:hypothetical protein
MNKQIKNKNWAIAYHPESNCYVEQNLDEEIAPGIEIIRTHLTEKQVHDKCDLYNKEISIEPNRFYESQWYKDLEKFRVSLNGNVEKQTRILKNMDNILYGDLFKYQRESKERLDILTTMFDEFVQNFKKNYLETINYIKRTNNL